MNLLKGCDGRFAGFFYGLHRALRLKAALLATVHSAQWRELRNVKAIVHRAAEDIKADIFWKRVFVLLRAKFPLLKLLRLADSNEASMDKLYFLLNKTQQQVISLLLPTKQMPITTTTTTRSKLTTRTITTTQDSSTTKMKMYTKSMMSGVPLSLLSRLGFSNRLPKQYLIVLQNWVLTSPLQLGCVQSILILYKMFGIGWLVDLI